MQSNKTTNSEGAEEECRWTKERVEQALITNVLGKSV